MMDVAALKRELDGLKIEDNPPDDVRLGNSGSIEILRLRSVTSDKAEQFVERVFQHERD